MPKEKKVLKEEEIKNVSGGGITRSNYFVKCKDCGREWETRSVGLSKKCPSCGSTNVERN